MRNTLIFAVICAFVVGCSSSSDTGGGAQDSAIGDSAVTDSAHVDSTSDAPVDATGGACGDKTCGASQLCVRTYTSGGACLACGDGGSCAAGSHCEGSCCTADAPSYSYACIDPPASCAASLTCASCGSDLCKGGCGQCESIDGSTVTCHCLAP